MRDLNAKVCISYLFIIISSFLVNVAQHFNLHLDKICYSQILSRRRRRGPGRPPKDPDGPKRRRERMKCMKCGKSFQKYENFEAHMRGHFGKKVIIALILYIQLLVSHNLCKRSNHLINFICLIKNWSLSFLHIFKTIYVRSYWREICLTAFWRCLVSKDINQQIIPTNGTKNKT